VGPAAAIVPGGIGSLAVIVSECWRSHLAPAGAEPSCAIMLHVGSTLLRHSTDLTPSRTWAACIWVLVSCFGANQRLSVGASRKGWLGDVTNAGYSSLPGTRRTGKGRGDLVGPARRHAGL